MARQVMQASLLCLMVLLLVASYVASSEVSLPISLLWPPCVAHANIVFYFICLFVYFAAVVTFFLLFDPRLMSAVGDRMSTILLHVVWP